MKKLLTLLILSLLIPSLVCAQFKFEQGYFLNNEGQKTNCELLIEDWRVSPNSIIFKTSADQEITKSIEEITEFGVPGKIKYIRKTVQVDLSSDQADQLSFSRNAEMEERTVFLKVIVEGGSSLFVYTAADIDRPRFFYSVNESKIEQLVYKRYKVTNITARKNDQFRQQLTNNMSCGQSDYNRLMYYQKGLEKEFIKYNECIQSAFKVYKYEDKNTPIRFYVKAGIQYSRFILDKNFVTPIPFDRRTTFRIGGSMEYILPLKKPNWTLFVEPTFKTYAATAERPQFNISTVQIAYSAIEFPFGIRYYPIRKANLECFLQTALVIDMPLESAYQLGSQPLQRLGYRNNNINFGVGINYKRLGLALQFYNFIRAIDPFEYSDTRYDEMALTFGYRLNR